MTTTDVPEKAQPFPLTFTIPAGFHQVDLHEDPGQRAQRLRQSLQRTLPTLGEDELLHVIFANEYVIDRMIADGAIYCANFIGRSDRDPTAASTAQFVVSTKRGPTGVKRPLDAAAEALRRENKAGRTLDLVDLPIGRCLTIIEDDQLRMPVNIVGHKTDKVHRMRQIQVVYPLVDSGKLAFFALVTECLRDWDDYVQMMAAICKTIERAEPERTTIRSRLAGL